MAAGAWLTAPAFGVVMLFPLGIALWFYRDPERFSNAPSADWTSPADGRVVEVEEAFDEYTGNAVKIGIFMSGLDVHVNRFPTGGTVEAIRYVPGKKWFAIAPKASEVNERLYVGIATDAGRTVLVQIAGILARRIVCRVRIGDTLARGERYGMIKLGSKVDVYLPGDIKPAVAVGDRVKAGETVIGVKR